MKYPALTILLCLAFALVSNAQKLKKVFEIRNNPIVLVHDKQGNMFVAGNFTDSTIDADPSPGTTLLNNAGFIDLFVVKYDPAGNLVAAMRIGGRHRDMMHALDVDAAGNVYVTGIFEDTVDFDPSAAVANLAAPINPANTVFSTEMFVAKYNNNLQYQWAFSMGAPNTIEGASCLKADHNGNIVIGGGFYGPNTSIDFDPSPNVALITAHGNRAGFVAKYSPSGSLLWVKDFNPPNPTPHVNIHDLVIGKSNQVTIAGTVFGEMDLDPGPGISIVTSSPNNTSTVLLQLDASGNYNWGFSYNSDAGFAINRLRTDSLSNIFITGSISTTVDMNPGPGTDTLQPSNGKAFVAKYDSIAAFSWARNFGTGTGFISPMDLVLRNDGFVVAGYLGGPTDMDPSPMSEVIGSVPSFISDAFVGHYSFSGELISCFGIVGQFDDVINRLSTNQDNEVVAIGRFVGTDVDFDPSHAQYRMTSQGMEGFVATYGNFIPRNKIKASAYIDNNTNGIKDAGENYYTKATFVSVQGQDTSKVFSPTGQVTIAADTGIFINSVLPYHSYFVTVPAKDTSHFPGYQGSDSVSFALQPVAGVKDLNIYLWPRNVARPGFKLQYNIVYDNAGSSAMPNPSIRFVRDARTFFDSASVTPSSIIGDTISWNLPPLPMGTGGYIVIYLTAATPPTLSIADTLKYSASIFPVVNDTTPLNNLAVFRQRVSGAYDPNDKQESHGGVISPAQITDGEYLQYTVRFQNTGTDTAFNISVTDTLSNKLDWSSFQMIRASHAYQLRIDEGNKCTWQFDDILLPDSTTNELLSHGYIVFRIKPAPAISIGTVILNNASIYFDYNPPVVTNTNETRIQMPAASFQLIQFTAVKNGTKNVLDWKTAMEMNTSNFEVQRSDNGIDFYSIGKVNAIGGSTGHIYSYTDLQPLKSWNYYRLRIMDKDGKFGMTDIRRVSNHISLVVNVYPNPASEKLVLQIVSPKKSNALIEIVTTEGKAILSTKLVLNEGMTSTQFDLSSLAAGVYFLRVTTDEEQAAIKFTRH